ncbi:hypothetical protein GCM10010259_05670 [Streptomyces daghestanicus]|uniref:Uncharacterized protein n=3 Tax=Streptomyces TaxID=1883 RepID=A0A918GCV4_STRGD|nr:hypothetical protein [Streptomyces griseoviridis]GGS30393.1 hypothetical protein GCM10010238_19360 [Streptomyces niveoruber]GGS82850.1 hypothetical protein GCM10010240_15340 [Streptomyces griseoviridis]GGU18267.1 hypothetical protein GCM10010259_05670 [Streptomyces daghestanicus]GHI33742.1 hypothetical protein Sdagh_54720 [Streptomyces daghestanicus]
MTSAPETDWQRTYRQWFEHARVRCAGGWLASRKGVSGGGSCGASTGGPGRAWSAGRDLPRVPAEPFRLARIGGGCQ